MKHGGVIFDMDGTLIDNIKFHKESWLKFLYSYDIFIEPEKFNAQNHGTINEMIVRFFGNKLTQKEINELGQEKEQTYRDLYQNHITEISGLTKLLQQLKVTNVKIGLATMGDLPNINFILDNLKIREYFDAITGGHEVEKGKPHPEIFTKTLKKLKLASDNCIVIEDSLGGIKSAESAGLKVIGITTTHTSEELLRNGCFKTINDFENLL